MKIVYKLDIMKTKMGIQGFLVAVIPTGMARLIRRILWPVMVLGLLGCSHQPCAAPPPHLEHCTPLTYYDFATPSKGFCEHQVFGSTGFIAEPVNAFFAATTFLLGLLGLLRSKRTTMAFQFLYGLLATYGLFAVAYHVTLANGFYRMMDVAIGFGQSFIIIMLFHSLYLYHLKVTEPAKRRYRYRILSNIMTLVFTVYPAVVHVAGEASPDPLVAWLVFDLLWGLIALLLILIWRRRKTWPRTAEDDPVFRLVWYAIGACALAYGVWCVDKFLCSCETPALAYLQLHGGWHLFMGLCFYYMITLNRYFSAHEYGFTPRLDRLPVIRLPFVEWKSRRAS